MGSLERRERRGRRQGEPITSRQFTEKSGSGLAQRHRATWPDPRAAGRVLALESRARSVAVEHRTSRLCQAIAGSLGVRDVLGRLGDQKVPRPASSSVTPCIAICCSQAQASAHFRAPALIGVSCRLLGLLVSTPDFKQHCMVWIGSTVCWKPHSAFQN